ncbi:SpoIIE family protein phosphatase [Streptomyces diacarni]|uniref:ATP-binding SpoIIE family protein phosphatase n=1 Tax=Streptomyces diacarni TaxID=2800381 RepID=UPI003F4D21DB
MNFTRWSARLPGTQRRTAAAQAAIKARAQSSGPAHADRSESDSEGDRESHGDEGHGDGGSDASGGTGAEAEGTGGDEGGARGSRSDSEPGLHADVRSGGYAGAHVATQPPPADTEPYPRDTTAGGDARADVSTRTRAQGSAETPTGPGPQPAPDTRAAETPTVPGARGRPRSETDPLSAKGDTGAPKARGGTRPPRQRGGIDTLPVHDLLGQVPALAAIVHGPEHRIAFVNDAYTRVFGPRPTGAAAREALPELVELGLLPLMDQVRRSGTPRTVKSRRVQQRQTGTTSGVPAGCSGGSKGAPTGPKGAAAGGAKGATRQESRRRTGHYYTFTCTPITTSDDSGVLIFAAEVTDQVEAVERLRASERRQREAAVTLQRSLLPQELEQPDDLRVAATYQPGGTDAAVGGDWYDVITLGAGRTALVIGDVMGRGVRAAAVMGQLRTAVRAYARLDLPPHEVLQLLDDLAAEIDATQIATCVYAVHDPSEGHLSYASAGHVPVLVRDPDGTVRRATDHTGPPLGTGGWLHTSGSVPLPPGAAAVLYTDGLIERRDADIDEGVAALEAAFAGATGSPDIVCDRLLRALGITEDHDDDVAVLVCQHPERTGTDAELFHNAALDLLGGTEAAPRARAFASGVLASWRFPVELRDLGVLAASELVANSLQHGTPPMRLRLRRTDRRLIVEVTDGDDHLPRRRRAEPGDESGRGISIVATIASSWGCRRTPGGGKSVWCEFALPSA